MDPTFAGHMRRYLAAVIAEHRLAEPPATGCTAGDNDLADGLADHVLDVIVAAFVEPDGTPHVVHAAGAIEVDEPYFRLDPDDPDGKRHAKDEHGKSIKVTGSRRVGPTDCPDCGRGLSSRDPGLTNRGHDMICPQVDTAIELHGCHPGCIVACGQETDRA
jgi:hypothetical protein